jgi:ABC-type sugar transport system ATPase subunit
MKLELRNITKRFGTLVANDNISLTLAPGEILSLLGENGAGKSTLMNVLYGLLQPDEGQILLDDKQVKFSGPGEAMAAGVGMVHQHFMLIPVFTVAENVVLGHEPTGKVGNLDLDAARKLVKEISDRFGFNVDPDALIQDLPVGVAQARGRLDVCPADRELQPHHRGCRQRHRHGWPARRRAATTSTAPYRASCELTMSLPNTALSKKSATPAHGQAPPAAARPRGSRLA